MINSIDKNHHVNQRSLLPPWPENSDRAVFGLGCFWGAEKVFWETKGVYVTSVGYAGGQTENPNYESVCSGNTGHAEVVEIIFKPEIVSYFDLVIKFFESHNPTQGMRQGNDIGSQYRSIILCENEVQKKTAFFVKEKYNTKLISKGYNSITTEIIILNEYFLAESYHQQYLSKNPNGYCGLGGTGIKYDLTDVLA
tara:strand:+ start:139 stop:726 length:588 start_codon:yes stop_codon:yes gene_type:complete